MPRIIDAEIVLPNVSTSCREQQADWQENNVYLVSHVLNRTHYIYNTVPIIESRNVTFSISDNTTKATILGLTLSEGYYWIRIRGQEGIYKCTKESTVYTIHIEHNPDNITFTYNEGEENTTVINTTTLTAHYTYVSISSVDVKPLDEYYIPDSITRNRDLAAVAKSGSYTDLSDTPNIPDIADTQIAIHDADSNAHNGVDGRVSTIENVIPSEVYDEGNELADRFFVNSTVSTETATFRGNYNVVNDLGLSASSTHVQIATALDSTIVTADKNDYCNVEIPSTSFSEFEGYESFTTVDDYVEKYVIYNDAYTYVTDLNKSSLNITPGTTIAYLNNLLRVDRYKYVEVEGGTDYWDFDYTYNNSGFTADQWSTINSKATKANIDQIAINTGNISTNATNIAQLDSDLNKNYPYIGVSTNWGTIANNCYLRSTYFKDGVVPQKKGDLVFSQGTRNFHRCGDLVWDAGQGCYKTNPTFLFHLGEDNINPDWSQADTTKKDYIKNKPTTISGYGITDAKIESGTITLGSNTITPLTSHQDISGKADKVTSATSGNFAGLDANGNLTDSGKKAGDFVNIANIDVSNQSTTILQLVKNLFTSGSNHLDYARWYTVSDGAAVNITDKPVNGKGFVCIAMLARVANGPTYRYNLLCFVSGEPIPYVANVASDINSITWVQLTDTKNTAGSTDTSSKIYLVGATSQAANPQTYSDNEVYAQNGLLEAKEVQVNEAAKLVWDSTNQCMRITFN